METDFEDFLESKNLEIYPNSSIMFMDKKNNVHFIHDTDYPIEERYEELYLKYKKKINRFVKEIQKKTCFIRLMTSSEELVYVKEHEKYIRKVITKGNDHNEIIFLLKEQLDITNNIKFRYFILRGCKDEGSRKCLRSRFDGNDEFIAWCILNADIHSYKKS